MNNNNNMNTIKLLLSFVISSLLFISLLTYPAITQAGIEDKGPKATKNVELAYFRVFRFRPEWRYHGPGYFRCVNRCQMNIYGMVVRCKKRCS